MNHHRRRKSPNRSVSPASWWASAAYAKKDLESAKTALLGSGLLQEPPSDWRSVFSSMARGEALIRGASDFKPSSEDERKKSAAFYRVFQWRQVMSYAGLEIFAKPLIKSEQSKSRGGLAKGEF